MPSSSSISNTAEQTLFRPVANLPAPCASVAAPTHDAPRTFSPASHDTPTVTTASSPHSDAPRSLALAPTAEKSSHSEHPNAPPILFDTPSAPIDIPTAKAAFNAASTFTHVPPLTARGRHVDYFPLHHHKSPKERSPNYALQQRQRRPINYFSDDSPSPSSSVDSTFSMHRKRTSSPLSPTAPMPLPPVSPPVRPSSSQKPRQPVVKPTPNLRLNPLPRFHPANFESPPGAKPTRRNPHSGAATPHHRQYSDAQHKIQQYQRDIVAASAARAASLPISPTAIAKPNAPRLDPLGSPGPVTPLKLEPSDDYIGGAALGSPGPKPDRGRELVQRLVDKENERRRYSRRSESLSPAVSPAGGRG